MCTCMCNRVIMLYSRKKIGEISIKKQKLKFKEKLTEWEKIFANGMADIGLISNIYKHHKTQHQKRKPSDFKMGQRTE